MKDTIASVGAEQWMAGAGACLFLGLVLTYRGPIRGWIVGAVGFVRTRQSPQANSPTFRHEAVDASAAIIAAIGVFLAAFAALNAYRSPTSDRIEVVKTAITVTGLVGAVLAAVYAYRRQKITEADSHRADYAAYNERFTIAAAQLGDGKAAVRLAGVYAMDRLALDWQGSRQICINVLCSYLRMPPAIKDPQEPEVRDTILGLVHARISGQPTWPDCLLDLSRVEFVERADFSDSRFSTMTLGGSKFADSAIFANSTFTDIANFNNASFYGYTSFQDCTFEKEARFMGADLCPPRGDRSIHAKRTFSGATFKDVARFGTGWIGEDRSDFHGDVSFYRTVFESGSWFGGVTFYGEVTFRDAKFAEPPQFPGAHFYKMPDLGPTFPKDSRNAVVFHFKPKLESQRAKLVAAFPKAIFVDPESGENEKGAQPPE